MDLHGLLADPQAEPSLPVGATRIVCASGMAYAFVIAGNGITIPLIRRVATNIMAKDLKMHLRKTMIKHSPIL
jgi:hypothetical protein